MLKTCPFLHKKNYYANQPSLVISALLGRRIGILVAVR